MAGLILSERTMASLRALELRFMDKTCSILEQSTDPVSGLQRGALNTLMSGVPCSVELPALEDNPFGVPGPEMQGGAPRKAQRLIRLPLTHNGQAVTVKHKHIIRIDSLDYEVQDLGTDESFPTSILVDAELITESN
jgi:hypothetical protein